MDTTVTVTLPMMDASRSKAAKKGYKCWAKILSSVASPATNGHDYEGRFVGVGAEIEATVGDVVLHVDDSSTAGIGVVLVNSAGYGRVVWLDETAGKWAGALAKTARGLLAIDAESRIAKAAAALLVQDAAVPPVDPNRPNADKPMAAHARQYYERLAGIAVEPAPIDTAAIAAQIETLLAPLSDEQRADVYRRLPGVEHRG